MVLINAKCCKKLFEALIFKIRVEFFVVVYFFQHNFVASPYILMLNSVPHGFSAKWSSELATVIHGFRDINNFMVFVNKWLRKDLPQRSKVQLEHSWRELQANTGLSISSGTTCKIKLLSLNWKCSMHATFRLHFFPSRSGGTNNPV